MLIQSLLFYRLAVICGTPNDLHRPAVCVDPTTRKARRVLDQHGSVENACQHPADRQSTRVSSLAVPPSKLSLPSSTC